MLNSIEPQATGPDVGVALPSNPFSVMPIVAQERLGLYIHIPFCAQKCPYCDFNTYAGMENHIGATVEALCQEMARWQATLGQRTIDTLFLGGGTPTLLHREQLAQLFAAIHSNFTLSPSCEITSEANPGTVDRDKFEVLHGLGVNRLSIGVQSFQPEELAFLGRIHNVEDVVKAFWSARAAGFTNINLDFIFGLPGQSLANWQKTVDKAIALEPEHLSLYSLIVEPNTPLQHWVATGKVAAPDEDEAAAHYEYAMQRLAEAGYLQYEISNWAKATLSDQATQQAITEAAEQTPTYACQHNLIYWRNQEYLGIGPGAHSHLWLRPRDSGGDNAGDTTGENTGKGHSLNRRWGNRKPVPGYVKRIQQGASVEEFSEEIDVRSAMGETMMLGLRLLREGVPLQRFQALHGAALQTIFAKELTQLLDWGLIELDPVRIRLTPRGVLLGDQVFTYFLPN